MRFVDEAVEPEKDTFDTERMASGEPGLPRVFRWRGQVYEVVSVVRSWHTTGPCRHGSPEMYVRRHWYEVEVDTGEVMRLYFDRQPQKGGKPRKWWLFGVMELG